MHEYVLLHILQADIIALPALVITKGKVEHLFQYLVYLNWQLLNSGFFTIA